MPTGNTGYLSEMDIRIWMSDHDPSGNLLLDDYEFTAEDIRTASTLAVDAWNEELPCIDDYELYQFPYRHALLKGTCANLLKIRANLYRRNRLKYNLPGGAVDDQNRAKEYDDAGRELWKEYITWVRGKKRALNVERGWGTI